VLVFQRWLEPPNNEIATSLIGACCFALAALVSALRPLLLHSGVLPLVSNTTFNPMQSTLVAQVTRLDLTRLDLT
jgi:hypothetical protein